MQVQASRVSARIAALTAVALALALTWHPVTLGDDKRRPAPAADEQPRSAQHAVPQKGTLGGSNRLLSSRDVAAILAIAGEGTLPSSAVHCPAPGRRV